MMVLLMVLVLTVLTCGCGNILGIDDSTENGSVRNGVEVDSIKNGKYTVVDVREQIGGNNIRVFYFVSVVFENDEQERFYYEYESDDSKDSQYLKLAKLVPGDVIQCQDETFVIVED